MSINARDVVDAYQIADTEADRFSTTLSGQNAIGTIASLNTTIPNSLTNAAESSTSFSDQADRWVASLDMAAWGNATKGVSTSGQQSYGEYPPHLSDSKPTNASPQPITNAGPPSPWSDLNISLLNIMQKDPDKWAKFLELEGSSFHVRETLLNGKGIITIRMEAHEYSRDPKTGMYTDSDSSSFHAHMTQGNQLITDKGTNSVKKALFILFNSLMSQKLEHVSVTRIHSPLIERRTGPLSYTVRITSIRTSPRKPSNLATNISSPPIASHDNFFEIPHNLSQQDTFAFLTTQKRPAKTSPPYKTGRLRISKKVATAMIELGKLKIDCPRSSMGSILSKRLSMRFDLCGQNCNRTPENALCASPNEDLSPSRNFPLWTQYNETMYFDFPDFTVAEVLGIIIRPPFYGHIGQITIGP